MADQLILHIGPRKTGTTFLQDLMWSHGDELAAAGLYLPLNSYAEQLSAARSLSTAFKRSQWESITWETLAEEVRTRPGTAIVSQEQLASCADDDIARLLAAFGSIPVRVVLGARNLADQLPAAWQQEVRAGSPWSYDSYLTRMRTGPGLPTWVRQDPRLLIERWAAHVPREQIAVFVVPPSGSDPMTLWHRFVDAAGLGGIGELAATRRHNQSLGSGAIELIRRVNESAPEEDRSLVGAGLPSIIKALRFSKRAGAKLGLPSDHHAWVTQRAQEIIDGLSVAGVRVVGDPAELVVGPDAGTADQTVTDDVVADLAVEALVSILRKTVVQGRRHRRQLARANAEIDRLRAGSSTEAPGTAPRRRAAWWRPRGSKGSGAENL